MMVQINEPVNGVGSILTTIGGRLKEERARLGVSQTELGTIGGVGKTTQINYEKNERQPDAGYLAAAAAAGVDVLYVLTGTRTPRPVDGLSMAEEKVLDNYRSLHEEDQASVRRLTNALAESSGRYEVSKKA
jgi:transcriptional regulator with XRE-family HTH domain